MHPDQIQFKEHTEALEEEVEMSQKRKKKEEELKIRREKGLNRWGGATPMPKDAEAQDQRIAELTLAAMEEDVAHPWFEEKMRKEQEAKKKWKNRFYESLKRRFERVKSFSRSFTRRR